MRYKNKKDKLFFIENKLNCFHYIYILLSIKINLKNKLLIIIEFYSI